mgnify:CR=1 FL=1
MSIEKVRAYFKRFGIEDRIREFEVSSATVELAAVAVGVEGARIAKSLSFKVEDKPVIIVVAGDAKIDNSKYKAGSTPRRKCSPTRRPTASSDTTWEACAPSLCRRT